ncbi:hypothetical protein [Arsenophonus sp.]|uniref:hypothetical protein n=1 Tax=Arsenophonus sp. TaxID=1872640 RepID=UPI00285AB063|nr:hypothetical protein [Arsenophonus sp.]MDR5610019.1 hypothetical protein [Arsenophonus sp.]MDR5613691.1 hypothetical protein [Arsenophonus sp.]
MSKKQNEMLHLLLNKAYNKKSEVINNIKNQETSQQAKLVTSGALSLGDDIEKALAAESLLKDMYRYNDVNLATKLLDYPQHVVTCLLTIAKDYSGWAPDEPDNEGNEKKYYEYIAALQETNMFVTDEYTSSNVNYEANNYQQLLEKITDFYSYTSQKEYQEIYSSLKKLIKNSLAKVNEDNTTILFTHTILSSRKNIVKLQLYSSKVTFSFDIETEKNKPDEEYNFEIDLSRLTLHFMDFNLSSDDIKSLFQVDFTLLSDWLKQNNTKVENNNYLLCFN